MTQLPDPRTMKREPRVQCAGIDDDIRCIVMIPERKPSGLCFFHEKQEARRKGVGVR